MYAQMGMSVVSAFDSFGAAKHSAAMDKVSRDYQEKMSSISAAMQFNTLTENEIGTRDALVRASTAIQVQSMQDRASSEAGAAAAGVTGGSVTSTMRGMMRSNLQAKHSLRKRKEAEARAHTNNRRNVRLAQVMNKDISPIAQPSAASALLGLGASMLDIYDSHQPPS